MKLTNTIRDAFISSVMNDVPSVDHQEIFRAEATKLAVEALPPAVRRLWTNKETREFVKTVRVGHWRMAAHVPGVDETTVGALLKPLQEEHERRSNDQDEQRQLLRRSLHGAAYAAKTRKQLAEMLPEFEKYLPADEPAANRSLPVVANVVASFVQAGWPKGKKAVAA